ncbi:MAG TPA: GDSL-type esterase/lipase family protein [bacterium]|nr:GDSL-type esterase/lipase family protein [bacterium]
MSQLRHYIRNICFFRKPSPLRRGFRDLVREMWRIYIVRGAALAGLIVVSGSRHYVWIAIVIMEFWIWAVGYKPRAHDSNIFRLTADERLFEFVPDISYRYYYSGRNAYGEDFVRPARVGPLGHRIPEDGTPGPLADLHLIIFGDSSVFGEGVSYGSAFASEIERRLNEDASLGRAVSVINAGVPGYNTMQSVAWMKRLVPAFSPSVILLCVSLDDTLLWGSIAIGKDGEMVRLDAPLRHKVRERLKEFSYILYHLSQVYRFIRVEDYLKGLFMDRYIGFNLWSGSVSEMASLCHEHDVVPVVVILPGLWKLDGGYPWRGVHSTIRSECEGHGVSVIDPLDALQGFKGRELWVHPADPHPNELAHRIIGQFVAGSLVETLRTSVLSRTQAAT